MQNIVIDIRLVPQGEIKFDIYSVIVLYLRLESAGM